MKSFCTTIIFICLLFACSVGADFTAPVKLASPTTTFDDILADYHAGQYDKTIFQLADFIARKPKPKNIGEAKFLLGMAYLKSNEPVTAAAYFHRAETELPLLADLCSHYLVKSLEAGGQYAQAQFQLNYARKLHADSPFFETRDCNTHNADLIAKQGEHASAAAQYSKLAGSHSAYSAYTENHYLAGGQYELAGLWDKARVAYMKVFSAERIDRFTNMAFDRNRALVWLAGKASYPREYAAFVQGYAYAHYDEGRHRQAQPGLDLMREIQGGKFSEDDLFRLGMSAYFNHDNRKAHNIFADLAIRKNFPMADQALYRLAKVQTRMGDNVASRMSFTALRKRFPGARRSGEARYQIALLDLEENEYKKAYKYFKVRIARPSGGQKEYLTWLTAWTAFRSGYLKSAEQLFGNLLKEFGKSRDTDRYRYWRGVVLAERKRKKAAVNDWEKVNANPKTYYGMLAAKRLKELGYTAKSPLDSINTQGKTATGKALFFDTAKAFGNDGKRFQKLMEMGLRPEASMVAQRIAGSAATENNLGRLFHSAILLMRGGRYAKAKRLARSNGFYSYCKTLDAPMSETYWSIIYPLAYPELVNRYGGDQNLPASLVNAIMYCESNHNPRAHSPANAMGLMQVIPRTAREIAGELGIEDFDIGRMFEPETNIRFGTHYLRKMLDRFGGNEACAAASYNAGPDVTEKWFRFKKDLPIEYFIEEISYKETNRYVKKVLQTKELYELLY
jgi:soluble lytic murein transglycosylase-like protein